MTGTISDRRWKYTSPMTSTSVNSGICGKVNGRPPKSTVARFCRKYDTPIAEIKIEMRGALRNGR